MKFLIGLLVSICLLTGAAIGQTTVAAKPKVEVKVDEFTGKKTVRLLKVKLTPTVELDLESSVSTKPLNPFEASMQYAKLSFTNTGSTTLRTRDIELNFSVDNKIVKGGPGNVLVERKSEKIICVSDISKLALVGKGKTVKMKLGDTIFDLDTDTVKLIADFVRGVQIQN